MQRVEDRREMEKAIKIASVSDKSTDGDALANDAGLSFAQIIEEQQQLLFTVTTFYIYNETATYVTVN